MSMHWHSNVQLSGYQTSRPSIWNTPGQSKTRYHNSTYPSLPSDNGTFHPRCPCEYSGYPTSICICHLSVKTAFMAQPTSTKNWKSTIPLIDGARKRLQELGLRRASSSLDVNPASMITNEHDDVTEDERRDFFREIPNSLSFLLPVSPLKELLRGSEMDFSSPLQPPIGTRKGGEVVSPSLPLGCESNLSVHDDTPVEAEPSSLPPKTSDTVPSTLKASAMEFIPMPSSTQEPGLSTLAATGMEFTPSSSTTQESVFSTLKATAMEFTPSSSSTQEVLLTPVEYPIINTTDPLVPGAVYEADPTVTLHGGFAFDGKITFLVFGKLSISGKRQKLDDKSHKISVIRLATRTRKSVEENRTKHNASLGSPITKQESDWQTYRLATVTAYCDGDFNYDFGEASFSSDKPPMVQDRCELVFMVYGD